MTKKKNPELPSEFDDFEMNENRFKELFEDDNALENTERFLNNLIKKSFNVSLPFDSLSDTESSKKNPHLDTFKHAFPKQSQPPPSKPSSNHPAHSKDSSSQGISEQASPPPQPKKGHFVSASSSKRPPPTKKQGQNISPSIQKKPLLRSSAPFLSMLKNTFKSFSNIFNTPKQSPPPSTPSPKTASSMDASLDRLKKREEDIKNLLDNNKGSLN